MKLPAVAIAAAFAGSILLGLSRFLSHRVAAYPFPALIAVIVLALLATGFALVRRDFAWPAAVVSMAAWTGWACLRGASRCNRSQRSKSFPASLRGKFL